MSEEAIASVEGESAALKSGKKQTRPEDSAQSQEQVWLGPVAYPLLLPSCPRAVQSIHHASPDPKINSMVTNTANNAS